MARCAALRSATVRSEMALLSSAASPVLLVVEEADELEEEEEEEEVEEVESSIIFGSGTLSCSCTGAHGPWDRSSPRSRNFSAFFLLLLRFQTAFLKPVKSQSQKQPHLHLVQSIQDASLPATFVE